MQYNLHTHTHLLTSIIWVRMWNICPTHMTGQLSGIHSLMVNEYQQLDSYYWPVSPNSTILYQTNYEMIRNSKWKRHTCFTAKMNISMHAWIGMCGTYRNHIKIQSIGFPWACYKRHQSCCTFNNTSLNPIKWEMDMMMMKWWVLCVPMQIHIEHVMCFTRLL